MSFWGSLSQILSNENEEISENLPEMRETPFRRSVEQAIMLDTGKEEDVVKAWENLLVKQQPTWTTGGNKEDMPSFGNNWNPNGENPPVDYDPSNVGNVSDDAPSHHADEGSDEFTAKAVSPLPEMEDNSCWLSLEFGHNTFGKLGRTATMSRSWYGINWLDKRTIVLRSAMLNLKNKLIEMEARQHQTENDVEALDSIKKDLKKLEEEHLDWCLETRALRNLISNLQKENSSFKNDNEQLKAEVGSLKEELRKTNKVVLKMIDYMSGNENTGLPRDDQIVPQKKSETSRTPTILKQNPTKVDAPSLEKKEVPKTPKSNTSPEDSESESDPEIQDPTKFLETKIMDPVKRRIKMAKNKKEPSANKTALNELPKYGGPTAKMTSEEVQRMTLTWLNKVEGLVLTGEVSIQDVYDRLPYLLEENAQTWFRQRVITAGHFRTWEEFRQALLTVFLGPDWKYALERSFSTIRQEEKEPGVNYVLRVWSLAKKIDPLYQESAILAKIATTMKPKLWNRIPRDERNDYHTLVRVVAAYDEEMPQYNQLQKEQGFNKKHQKMTSPTFKEQSFNQRAIREKIRPKRCFLCEKEGHIAKECPSRKLIASAIADNDAKNNSKVQGKGKGALPGTR